MSTSRTRRATRRVDYAKEQEFSDQDVFEDSENEETPATAISAAAKRRGRKSNKSSATVRAAVVSTSSHAATPNAIDGHDEDEYVHRPVYIEKGYDPSLPPIRERFPFLPEYEEDGSPKIELIVGRRPVDEKEEAHDESTKQKSAAGGLVGTDDEDGEDHERGADEVEEEGEEVGPTTRKRRGRPATPASKKKVSTPTPPKKKDSEDGSNKASATASGPAEYEYLVKYKGRSYLHLEWKSGADLESMNKSAKGIYRRYVKKLHAGGDEDLENPEFDPSFIIPEKILDEAEQEITVELTDKELLRWEKQREKELAAEDDEEMEDEQNDENGHGGQTNLDQQFSAAEQAQNGESSASNGGGTEEEKKDNAMEIDDDWSGDEIEFDKLTIEKLKAVVYREGPYYPVVEGSTNPYRDGYVTEPPKKPRASYLFFQCSMRSFYQKKFPHAVQSELMSMLAEKWRTMSDEEREPFVQLAKEEAAQFEKEKVLLAKAQRPNEVWQPLRRCMLVLDRLTKDSFAEIFLEPVNTKEFTDYEDIIDNPMDLGTVRTKLMTKKYQAPEQFARDMRRIWNNCKIYNQHGSAIWHVADYMSKQFERLYHAWVLEFRERYLRWGDPRARPWEHTCRMHDGTCKTPDDQMVLCDHCDAMYGIRCLQPPLKKIPTRAWHCPDCKPKLKSVKGFRMLSAVAENAARKRAELGDLPKKKVKQTMFLVKWAGLGYEFCTWETRADINDDRLIGEFRRINNSTPEETDMSMEVVDKVLDEVKHISEENAGGSGCVPLLRTQLYAQTRSFQFLKFGVADPPELLCSECGPKSKAVSLIPLDDSCFSSNQQTITHPREVLECVTDLVFKVARRVPVAPLRSHTSLPPPMVGEYDAIIPITAKGLMMNVGEISGSVAFLGYRSFPDGSKGPAELANLVRNVGDKITAVDGISTIGKTFQDVIKLLRESGKNKFAYMRFLEARFSGCEPSLASVGDKGRYAIEELQKKFITDRQRMIVQRQQHLIEEESEPTELPIKDEILGDHDSEQESGEGSEGEFQPESDDEEQMVPKEASENLEHPHAANDKPIAATPSTTPSTQTILDTPAVVPAPSSEIPVNPDQQSLSVLQQDAMDVTTTPLPTTPTSAQIWIKIPETEAITQPEVNLIADEAPTSSYVNAILHREETTQSLAFRLLDMDVGYSSDEGGDEDRAYFVDGVDQTFTAREELDGMLPEDKELKKDDEKTTVPARLNEFTTLGDRAKLTAAVFLSANPPEYDDFDNFPSLSKKELSDLAEQNEARDLTDSPSKAGRRSNVKVEQISIATGETLHVWANIEAAAATLQLPLNALKQVLRGEYDEDIGDEVGGFKWRYALVGAKVTAGLGSSSRGGGGKKAKEAWLEFRDKLYDPNEPHIYKNGNRLRDYQVDGVNWLSSTWYKRQSCILADEMGLGKTVQIVCYIEHLFRVEKIRRPYLVVVPLSTVEHWRREFEGWTDMVCCIYHDRQRVWRDVLREYEWYYEDRPHTPEYLKFDVLVTTYDTLIGDFDVISQIPFRVAVVDEAHRLRNQKGKLLECMREISAKGTMQYGFQSRVLMSGTPLQNDLAELWTLLNFIEPFKFPDLTDFHARFGNMANRDQVEKLQQLISPYMLRRVKEDVAKDIPAKEETVIDVELTSLQKQYYRAIFEHNHAFLSLGTTRQTAPKLMNIQMELRKVCNHPFLLDGVEHREMDRFYREFSEKGLFQGKTPEEQQHMLNEQGYIMLSGKMVLLDKLLPKLKQEGHKVLIFSQMVKMLDMISEYCEFRDFRYERLDGRVRGTERQKAIDRFEREADSFVFLLSTRAGGVGINLTAADICIIFDSDWNPQNDIQAQARCHRIGQTKDVRIYRLITSRSFEQEMFDRASKKLGLEQAILGTFEKDQEDDKPSHEEMEQLLRRGAYALLEDENDEITKQFCADDIESILAKRTRTRVVEGAKTASWLNKNGMLVSKSKFSAEAGGESLDMDDPLFWQKVMPDFVTPSLMLQKLNDLQFEIEGTVKGPGRGRKRRGRPRKDAAEKKGSVSFAISVEKTEDEEKVEEDEPAEKSEDRSIADASITHETADEGSDDQAEKGKGKPNNKLQISRTNIRKIQKFMSDLKSMMESVLDEAEDETLSSDEKSILQKLLLTVSVKEKIFSEDHRLLARSFLKRLEGDRRRRCRTSEQRRFTPGQVEDEITNVIPEELRIAGRKRKKRRKKGEEDEEEGTTQRRRKRKISAEDGGGYVGEDGFLHHSDSGEDWSDVGEDAYKTKETISMKEARRRRQWATDDDDATAAGRPWPVFPRHVVKKVLTTLLDEMIKYDKSRGGVFSEPVSRDDFPEYYEQIKKPMDYGTMKTKLENDEYRSAQAMQKDFILMLQNCREFNAKSSDIVREAREQHLLRPKLLKESAMKHGLFIAEDGTVLEIVEEKTKSPKKTRRRKGADDDEEGQEIKKKRGRKATADDTDDDEESKAKSGDDQEDDNLDQTEKKPKQVVRRKRKMPKQDEKDSAVENGEANVVSSRPRIRINVKETKVAASDDAQVTRSKRKLPKRKRSSTPDETDEVDVDEPEMETEAPLSKRRKTEFSKTRRRKASTADVEEDSDDHKEIENTETQSDQSDVASKFLFDVAALKKSREQLDGSFDSARDRLTSIGPWKLPDEIKDKFQDVALLTLAKMDKHDRYSVFAEPVAEDEAPDYYDVVEKPMDFGTMKQKVMSGDYGSGSTAAAALYNDFLLVFDNCSLYNPEDSEVAEEASRVLGMLPETYASACALVQKKK